MGRDREITEALHKYIFAEYIWKGKGQATIIRQIENDKTLQDRVGGIPSAPTVSYHVKQINEELENSIDFDAMDKFVGEFLRYQQSIDAEIEDIEKVLELVDKEKKPEMWLALKRFKKDLLDSRLKALADHELPLAVKRFKKERNEKKVQILRLSDQPKELE